MRMMGLVLRSWKTHPPCVWLGYMRAMAGIFNKSVDSNSFKVKFAGSLETNKVDAL